jgi:hypothetical protein
MNGEKGERWGVKSCCVSGSPVCTQGRGRTNKRVRQAQEAKSYICA